MAQVEGIRPERLNRLLDAAVDVSSESTLASVLRHVVEQAIRLVDARYGALGVIGPNRGITDFVYVGIDAETAEPIGPLPTGRGLLGAVIEQGCALRVDDIANDPRSIGFPENHPPMRTFLGVPIRIDDEVFGNLYLCDKVGGEPFTEEDQAVVEALAGTAGVAVVHSRSNEERTRAWQGALRDVTAALLEARGRHELLQLIVDCSPSLVNADIGFAALVDGEDLVVEAASESAADLVGTTIPQTLPVEDELGPTMILPLAHGGQPMGVLAVVRKDPQPFDEQDLGVMRSLADQAAVVLAVAEVRAELARVHVRQDRERIARDLHDTVIQRIFAAGMSLEAAMQGVTDGDTLSRVGDVVDQLDDTIRDIRSTIFSLNSTAHRSGFRYAVQEIVEEAAKALGFQPAVRFTGPLDSALDETLSADAIAVVREGLANVAKHASATRVVVEITLVDGHLGITITDNGEGIGPRPSPGGRGLANLADRATRHGGELSVGVGTHGGTQLHWLVPVPS